MAKKDLRVGYLPIIDHLILGIANETPLENANLILEQKFGWNEVGDALMHDQLDVAFILAPYACDIFYSEKKQGKPSIKLLLLSHRDGSVIVANKKSNVKTLADFKGKTVLIPYQASMHHILLHKRLLEEGVTVGIGKDVTTEVVAPGQIPMMIEYDPEGQIAGYIVAEPFGTQVVNNQLGDLLCLSKDIVAGHPCCAVVAKEEVVAENPEAIQCLVSALVKAGKSVFENVEATIKTASAFMSQSEDVVRTILTDSNRRVCMDNLMPTVVEFDFMQDYLIDKVTTPSLSGKINVDEFFDLRFAKEAGA